LSTWGARGGEVGAFRKLLEALRQFDEQTVAAFCTQLNALASVGVQESRPSKSSGKSKIDDALAQKYVLAFSAEDLSYSTMHEWLDVLRGDKKAKLPELKAIASHLSGVEASFKNKSEALDKIETVIRRRLDTGRRLEGTSGIF
jgi:hypothetical protein